jgi:uncharacterized protein
MQRSENRSAAETRPSGAGGFSYFFLGILFGIVLLKSEAVSWFRIQEMFRFQSFHMFGILFSAIAVAGLSLFVLRRTGVRTLAGEPIVVPSKSLGRGVRYAIGGLLFGIGWALTGACPGPMFALVGGGLPVYGVVVASALAGTWAYGLLRPRLPH